MQRCPACDHFNLADADSCERCGKPLSSATADEGPVAAAGEPSPDSFEGQVLQTVRSNGKIAAIKLYREQRGGNLMEAKEAVEAFMAQSGVTAGGPGTAGGCGARVLAMLIAFTMIVRLLSA